MGLLRQTSITFQSRFGTMDQRRICTDIAAGDDNIPNLKPSVRMEL